MRGSMRERRPGVWELIVQLPRDPTSARARQLSRTVHGTKREAQRASGRAHRRGLGRQGHLDGDAAERAARPLARPRQRAAVPDDRARVPTSRAHDARPRPRQAPAAAGHHPAHRRLLRQPRSRARPLAGVHPTRPRRPPGCARPGGAVGLDLVERSRQCLAAQAPPPGDHAAGDARRSRHCWRPPTTHDVEFGAVLRVLVATGARRGEVCGLRWSDVDVAGEHGHDPALGGLGRRRHGREGDQDPRCSSHRRRRRDLGRAGTATENARSSWRRRAGSTSTLTASCSRREPDGSRPLHPDTITGGFQRLCQRAGLDGVRLHDLRHLHATQLLAAGVPVRTVSGRLGHANAATTLNVYAHFLEASDRQAADVIAGLLDTPDQPAPCR